MMKRVQQLAEIIVRVKLKIALPEERALLGAWLDESEENRQLFKNIIRGESIAGRIRLEMDIDQTADYRLICDEVYRKLIAGRYRRRQWIAWSGVGAASVVLLLIGVSRFAPRVEERPASDPVYPVISSVLTEKGKVALIIAGNRINLDHGVSVVLQRSPFIEVDTATGVLKYREERDSLPARSGRLEYPPVDEIPVREPMIHAGGLDSREYRDSFPPVEKHTLTTEVGGDYSFILSDGTRVWLNSVSSFTYPVVFTGGERVVELAGEAYFEVAPDADRPFIVRTADVQAKVLGTSFNISAYRDEANVYTTLLTGRVEVSVNGEAHGYSPVVLAEEMQSCWNRERGEFSVKQARAADVIAWRYGTFVFNEDDIGVVTRVLSRWYGVTFVYDNERVGRHTFGGKIKKDEKLEVILKTLTLAGGPEFRQEGDKIHVIERDGTWNK
ncbi:MAG: FecR domain-containing protein [Odoribacteraceae bacterium]|jgi:ferric-dicitrate binding protein FerR (iron transport regulator)|nr:FecR domain-containing protein [Odoribacteraceae bacterium]